jgi:hypothetical protein
MEGQSIIYNYTRGTFFTSITNLYLSVPLAILSIVIKESTIVIIILPPGYGRYTKAFETFEVVTPTWITS